MKGNTNGGPEMDRRAFLKRTVETATGAAAAGLGVLTLSGSAEARIGSEAASPEALAYLNTKKEMLRQALHLRSLEFRLVQQTRIPGHFIVEAVVDGTLRGHVSFYDGTRGGSLRVPQRISDIPDGDLVDALMRALPRLEDEARRSRIDFRYDENALSILAAWGIRLDRSGISGSAYSHSEKRIVRLNGDIASDTASVSARVVPGPTPRVEVVEVTPRGTTTLVFVPFALPPMPKEAEQFIDPQLRAIPVAVSISRSR